MEINWLGHACIRLKGRQTTVLIDPYPPELGRTLAKLTADVLLVTHDHPGHSYVQALAGRPYTVSSPGEYEVGEVIISGFSTFHDAEQGARRGRNTVYLVEIDEIRVVHLGDLAHLLEDDIVESLGAVDCLMVPVGGHDTMDAAQAAELVREVGPKVVIPIHYLVPELSAQLDPLDRFLKEMAKEQVEPQAKLVLNSSPAGEETRLVVLEISR